MLIISDMEKRVNLLAHLGSHLITSSTTQTPTPASLRVPSKVSYINHPKDRLQKKNLLLSIESWLFNRDPYNGWL